MYENTQHEPRAIGSRDASNDVFSLLTFSSCILSSLTPIVGILLFLATNMNMSNAWIRSLALTALV
jgi:hypothetical protein